jgi:hypothetical protein
MLDYLIQLSADTRIADTNFYRTHEFIDRFLSESRGFSLRFHAYKMPPIGVD